MIPLLRVLPGSPTLHLCNHIFVDLSLSSNNIESKENKRYIISITQQSKIITTHILMRKQLINHKLHFLRKWSSVANFKIQQHYIVKKQLRLFTSLYISHKFTTARNNLFYLLKDYHKLSFTFAWISLENSPGKR